MIWKWLELPRQRIQTITTKIPISSKNFVDIAWILGMSQKAFSFIGEDYRKISISIPDMTIWQHPFNDFFRSFTFNQNIWGWMFNLWIIRHSYLDWMEKEIIRYLEIRTGKRPATNELLIRKRIVKYWGYNHNKRKYKKCFTSLLRHYCCLNHVIRNSMTL